MPKMLDLRVSRLSDFKRVEIMYAIIESGGKQYRVTEGQSIKLEKLDVDAGGTINFDRVLMIGDGENSSIGAPMVTGAKVVAEVEAHGRHKKIKILKFKRRKHHMKQQGHRQDYTQVKVTQIAV